MPKIVKFQVKNFRTLKDITLGNIVGEILTPLTVVIGKNGVGKSTLLDALTPEEVWILDKGEDGFATIRRASDDPLVNNLVKEEFPLGRLWYSDYLEAK